MANRPALPEHRPSPEHGASHERICQRLEDGSRCRRHRVADPGQARHVHQRARPRHHRRARHAPRTARGESAEGRSAFARASRTASSPAPTSRSSPASQSATEAYALIRNGQLVFEQLESLPAPRSLRFTASRWAAGSSSRSRAVIASPLATIACRWACPKCSSAFIRDSAAPCARCASSA